MTASKFSYYLDMLEIVLLCAVAFLIPVHIEYSSPVIVALSVMFLARPRNYRALRESVRTLGFWAMIIPFMLYLVGLTYSDDLGTALRNTETALSLFAFPFLATAFRQNSIAKKLDLVELSLIAGILVIMIFSIINAYSNYLETQNANEFFYTHLLRSPHHHSYYAMFAIIILTENIMRENWKQRKLLIISEIILVVANIGFICLLSSKITIIILCIYAICLIIRMLVSKEIPKWLSIVTSVGIIALALTIMSIPMVKFRLDSMIASVKAQHDGDETAYMRNESTAIRINCMASATEVISENWLIGTGQGDVYAEMEKKMKMRLGEKYEGTCSPHNQFLRSFASFGILGIASLLMLFFAMFRKAIKSRNSTMIWWCIITLCFFCIEDMFCIINGIIFFCLFTGIMLLGKNNGQLAMDN